MIEKETPKKKQEIGKSLSEFGVDIWSHRCHILNDRNAPLFAVRVLALMPLFTTVVRSASSSLLSATAPLYVSVISVLNIVNRNKSHIDHY